MTRRGVVSLLEALLRKGTTGAVRQNREELERLLHRTLGSEAKRVTVDRLVLVSLVEEVLQYRDLAASAGDVGMAALERALGLSKSAPVPPPTVITPPMQLPPHLRGEK